MAGLTRKYPYREALPASMGETNVTELPTAHTADLDASTRSAVRRVLLARLLVIVPRG